MGYEDARNLVGGLFQSVRTLDGPYWDEKNAATADELTDPLSSAEIESYCDAALDAANRSLADAVRRLSESAERFDQWFPDYSVQAEASRRNSRATSRQLGLALAKWDIGRDAGQ
jgi:hypothetical protein